MPLTQKGHTIMSSMVKQYGPEKGPSVFYASKNAGRLSGVDTADEAAGGPPRMDTALGPKDMTPAMINAENEKFWRQKRTHQPLE